VKHQANHRFWACFIRLPRHAQKQAIKSHQMIKRDPRHPSLHFKQIGRFWSARAGIHTRALGVQTEDGQTIVWFWIGSHAEYDRLIG